MMDETMMRDAKEAGQEAGVTNRKNEQPLESWKEIAAYLKRDTRTVRRWEKSEKLPVRRHHHLSRASVYAYPSELDAWKQSRNPAAEAGGIFFRWPVRLPAFAMTLLLALVTAGGGLIHPPATSAQSAAIVTKRMWSGLGVDVLGAPSPDGRFLSYVHWRSGNLAIRDLASGEDRQVTTDGLWGDNHGSYAYYSIWSPDGKRIAVEWYHEDKPELRIITLEGGGPPVVLHRNPNLGRLRPHTWSADGKTILANFRTWDGANQIVLVSVPDGAARVLKTLDWRYPTKMSLSPDGKYVVYDFPPDENSQQRDIFLLHTDGGREIPWPTLLTQTSMRPKRRSASWTTRRTSSRCVTSATSG